MKKLFIFCAALAFVFSACSPLSLLDPIPQPGNGWVYVQAQLPDGTELCERLTGPSPWGVGNGIVDETFVDAFLTSAFAVLPFGAGATTTVHIESTLNNWTLDGMTHQLFSGGTPFFTIPSTNLKYLPNGAVYPNELILNDGTDDIVKLSWLPRHQEIIPFSPLQLPTYSGDITITRIDPYRGSIGNMVGFHVRAYPYFSFSLAGFDYSDRFTGFQLQMGSEESAAALIAAELTKAKVDAALEAGDALNDITDDVMNDLNSGTTPSIGATVTWAQTIGKVDVDVTVPAIPPYVVTWAPTVKQIFLTATVTVGTKKVTKDFVY